MNTLSTLKTYSKKEHVTKSEKPIKLWLMNAFGDNLRARRELKSISTWQVEKLTGISRSNLVSIEKGRRPASEDVLQKLASIPELELSIEEMLSWKALDQYGPDIILKAANAVLAERSAQE